MTEQATSGFFELGAFQTTTGHTLQDAKLNYKTHGTLNAAKDNAILFPHFLGGAPEAVEGWIGEGRALDSSKYFFILPGQFGNGVSTSPSNAVPSLNGGAFPPLTFADDVIAQHRLVTEKFGINELQLVLGWSTGGLQIYEWAVRFAPMVKRMAAIATAPMPSPWTKLWLYAVLEEPLTADPAWNNGFYADAQDLAGALRRLGHGTALTLPPTGFYREGHEMWRPLGFTSRDDFVSNFWEAFWLSQDPNNIICQARKGRAADPARGGDMAAALSQITAKTAVVAFTGDPMFPPAEGQFDAERIPNATFHIIESSFGHLATFSLSQDDVSAVDAILYDLLAS